MRFFAGRAPRLVVAVVVIVGLAVAFAPVQGVGSCADHARGGPRAGSCEAHDLTLLGSAALPFWPWLVVAVGAAAVAWAAVATVQGADAGRRGRRADEVPAQHVSGGRLDGR